MTATTNARLQRACSCGRSRQRNEEHLKKGALQRQTAGLASPFIHEVLRSPGQPLDQSTRELMEARFGHDFGRVRVHVDARAAGSARAVNARAYTVHKDIVFGAGEYAPATPSGRRLLLHELTHTVQQTGATPPVGSAGHAELGIGPEDDSSEREARRNAEALDTDAMLTSHSPAAAHLQREALEPTAGRPSLSGGTLPFRESRDLLECIRIMGDPEYCRQEVLGEAPQSCAIPGNARSVSLQPVFLRSSAADPAPTGTHWATFLRQANAIWRKLGVTFTEQAPVTLTNPANKGRGSDLAETNLVRATRSAAGVEVFMVDNQMAWTGGARTFGIASAAAQTVISDSPGASDTLFAHEAGHILGLGHPGLPAPLDVEPNTIMTPTGSHSVANPSRNPIGNFRRIRFPAPGAAMCLNPDP
jgi:hypothetical protein